jgi:hypothetical protein
VFVLYIYSALLLHDAVSVATLRAAERREINAFSSLSLKF